MTSRLSTRGEPAGALREFRPWVALLLFAAAWFTGPLIVERASGVLGRAFRIPEIPPHILTQSALAIYTFPNLVWSALVLCLIAFVLGRSPLDFPVGDAGALRRGGIGLATGAAAMLCVMVAIEITGAATVTWSGQAPGEALRNGLTWTALQASVGASEELFFRGALYLTIASLLGWRAAVIVSGLLFVLLHVGNPGASPIWLLRIGLSGMLLAFAVHRTQSIWWSIGYHAGWNWVSAPLFGAPGSGYTDQGHLLTYVARGPESITGGAVGPEGSIFAYLAMVAALGVLLLVTARRGRSEPDAANAPRADISAEPES